MGLTLTKEPTECEYHPVDLTPVESSPPVALVKKRGKGRPPKKDMEAVKNKNGKRGPIKGQVARMNELKERLLATGGTRILDTVIRIALDDNHPSQAAALKMCMDRMLPVSMFENEAKGHKGAITINIVGATDTQIISHKEEDPYTIDMEIPYAEEAEKDSEKDE